MNPATKYLNVTEQATVWDQIITTATDDCNKFSTALKKTIETVNELDNTFLLLNAQQMSVTSVNSFLNRLNTDEPIEQIPGISGDDSIQDIAIENGNSHKNGRKDESDTIPGVVAKIAKLGEGAIKAGEAFGELPPAVTSLKRAFSIAGDIIEGTKGIAGLFPETAEGTGSLEAASAAGEIAAGAAGVAKAGAAFGPPGWVVGTGALVVGGIAVAAASQKEERSYDAKEFAVDKWNKYYWDTELKKDREKLIELYHPKNYKQTDQIEEELNADFFVQDRLKRVDKSLGDQPYDAYDDSHKQVLNIPSVIVPATDRLGVTGNNIWDAGWTNGGFNQVCQALPTKNEEVYQFVNVAAKPKMASEPIYRLPKEDEWEAAMRNESKVPTQPAWKNSEQQSEQSYSSKSKSSEFPGGKIINININRPMIENFIINTKNSNEGVNEFKHQVEEVLLEILNSANVIQ